MFEVQECNGRKAAIAACQELLWKYADRHGVNATVEVSMYPEIEWRARDGERTG